MKIKELMTREVACCSPSTPLNEAAHIMWERDCGSLPVVEDGRAIAMITDRDICMAAYHRGLRLSDMRVQDAMSHQVFACEPDEDISRAEARMRERQVRRLPVVEDDGHLVGILSLASIVREATSSRRDGVSEHEVVATLAGICTPAAGVAQS